MSLMERMSERDTTTQLYLLINVSQHVGFALDHWQPDNQSCSMIDYTCLEERQY